MYKGGYTPDNLVIQNFWKVNNKEGTLLSIKYRLSYRQDPMIFLCSD